MSNKRMLSADLFEDDICAEDYFTRLLWIGIIVAAADDQGRLIDNPAIMKARIFPFDNDISDEQVNRSLEKIGKSIFRYSSYGKKLIQIVKWWKYQTPSWASASKYPAPEGWTDRVKVHSLGNKICTSNWDKAGGFVDNWLPIGLHSNLPSGVDRAINKSDVKSDVKSDCESEQDASLISPVQRMLENVTHLMPATPNDVKALDEITKLNPIQEDVQAAYDWYVGQGQRFNHYSSLIGPVRTAIAARVQDNRVVSRSNSTASIQERNKRVIEDLLREENG